MERRNFIKKTTFGSAMVMSTGFLSFSSNTEYGFNKIKDIIDPIIPIQYYPELKNKMLSYIIQLRENYGFRRFLITGPSKEFRYTGFPDEKVFIELGKQISDIKNELADYDIEIGWWCVTTIRIGKGKFQNIIKGDGSIAAEACCPLDLDYRETFGNRVAAVVRIALPFMVNFEDDYHLSGGCFCPLHLEEFGRRQNRNYDREELQSLLSAGTEESYRLQRAWAKLKKDSLTGLATTIREKVDVIAPETRLCLCQSGASERDGNFTEAVTSALAGNTRPIVRVHGSSYLSDHPLDIPRHIFNVLYQRQHLPSNFELIHESDSFPHTRFFMSSSKLKSLMIAAFAYGVDGSLFYANQYLENPLEEVGYREMFIKESRRFSALKSSVKEGNVEGCEIFRIPNTSYNWTNVMGRLGIPYTSKGGNVKLVSGNIVQQMDEDEIRELFKGGVFLDGHAARLLCKKGYGNLIGVNVSGREDAVLPPFYEGVRDPEKYNNLDNRLMYNYVWAFAKSNRDAFYQLEALEGTEVVTEFLNSRNEPSYPAMTRYENQLGGRVAVMAFNLDDGYVNTRSISLFNYTKKELMRQMIEWIGKAPLPVFVKDVPNAFCIFNRSKHNDYAIVVVTGLNSDTFETFSLDVSPEWINSKIERLDHIGKWRSIRTEAKNSTIKINTPLSLMTPIILKFIK